MDTLAALCAALDDRDDSVLPILADALEEVGDPRAARLHEAHRLPVFCCIHDRLWYVPILHAFYPTRSAAYLALAEALAAE